MNRKKNIPLKHKRVGAWQLHRLLEGMDVFGRELPSFNLKGAGAVHTLAGGIATFAILLVVMTYAMIKLLHLFEKHNPGVS